MRRILIIFIGFILIQKAFGQEINYLQQYILKIDTAKNYNKVYLSDTINKEKVNIVGFEKNDTLYKVELNFPNTNRKRIIYFRRGNYRFENVCLVKESNIQTNEIYINIEIWDNKIIKSYTKDVIDAKEKNDIEYIIKHYSYLEADLLFKSIDNRAEKYFLKGYLLEKLELPAGCGIFAFATAYKFRIIETDFKTRKKYIIVLIQCPREKGENFYKKGAIYQINLATNSGVPFEWSIYNKYEKQNLPTFWARQIEIIKR